MGSHVPPPNAQTIKKQNRILMTYIINCKKNKINGITYCIVSKGGLFINWKTSTLYLWQTSEVYSQAFSNTYLPLHILYSLSLAKIFLSINCNYVSNSISTQRVHKHWSISSHQVYVRKVLLCSLSSCQVYYKSNTT